LSEQETGRLISLTQLVVRGRSAVERDGYSREIELIPESEAPTRLVVVLARLLGGLDALGASRADGWAVVTKAALDCIPAIRRAAIGVLFDATDALKTAGVSEAIDYPTATTQRALEDLTAHGIAKRNAGKVNTWELSDFGREHYGAALDSPETSHVFINPDRMQDDISGEKP
jgi:predicted transcriptional regulator